METTYKVNGEVISFTFEDVKEKILGDTESLLTISEYTQFAEMAKVNKLNPFIKEIYIYKEGNKPAAIGISKQVIFDRAIASPDYDGHEQGIIVQTTMNEIVNREGTFYLPGEKVVGGWCKVYRKSWKIPRNITISMEEAQQTNGDGEVTENWKSKPATMIEKVVVVKALRETFIKETGYGMIEEELWNDETVDNNKNVVTEKVEEVKEIEVIKMRDL